MKILHLEDNVQDAELVVELLKTHLPGAAVTVVRNRKDFLNALIHDGFDLILADFDLPDFSGQAALKLAFEHRPDLPFIFLSGAVGEDTAIELVRQGAADYLLKDRMQRLPHAIQRAQKDAEDRLQRYYAEELIREQAELIEKTRDGIVVTDLAYSILSWNPGAAGIFGWSADEAIGQNALKLFGAGLESSAMAMEKHLATGEEWRGEIGVTSKAGKEILVEIRVTLIRDPLGQPKSCLSIINDITERRKLEEQFLRAQRLESLGMLATGLAHDLNNALAPIMMADAILRTRVTDPGDLKLLELIGRSGQRSAAMVRQIVSFASGDTREKVLIQAKHLLNDIQQLMQETFPKSIRLESDIPAGLWTVQGSPSQLHQMMVNLCINARDAMPRGGTLRLVARNQILTDEEARPFPDATPGPFVVFEVSDSGAGIPAFVIEHIWQPFFAAKNEGRGIGLGLSTVRGIVVSHNGFVTVTSQMGHGSTFRVFLPAAETLSTGGSASSSTPPFVIRGTGELVLVVDDEEGIRESVGAVLRQNGYRPLITSDGIEALAQYSGRLPEISLIISDLDMPGLGGVAFSKAILRLSPTTKILFISGAIEQPESTAGTAFLGKPFTGETLLLKVQELLRAKQE
jgi:two-component system, cell cycle sensor histidine kinase and response regulator CckA